MDTQGRKGLAVTLLGRYETLPRFIHLVLAVMEECGGDEIESLALALERIKNPLVKVPQEQPIGPRVLEEASAVI